MDPNSFFVPYFWVQDRANSIRIRKCELVIFAITCLVAQARQAWAPQQGRDTPRLHISPHTPHASASFAELMFVWKITRGLWENSVLSHELQISTSIRKGTQARDA
jgi:hypothetical protein